MEIFSPYFVRFRNDLANREMLFSEPAELLRPATPEEFHAALAIAENALDAGKWIAGYFSYEAGYLLDPKLRDYLPEQRNVPLACLGIFNDPVESPVEPAGQSQIQHPFTNPHSRWSFQEYTSRFDQLHRHLRQGDCYQGNLTFPVDADWTGKPDEIFQWLISRQPVRYGAMVNLGGPVVLSRSPELFFEVDTEGYLEALPMKGTARRGANPDEDAKQRFFLQNDAKNQAENRMIVDLLRNDISRISAVGTLEVPELFRIETYQTVFQMVSRIRARLLPDISLGDVLAALFPCGSITGAPKIRAMQILRELEPAPRGVYCGAIGWAAPTGAMRFNVAIRTLCLFANGNATFNVGGGIVFDSTAEAEFAECLLKARFAIGDLPIK
jgi:para-aminobenzoate synthetase component I